MMQKNLNFPFQSGKQMQYDLGKFLRRRYNRLIGPGYSPNKVYIRSSDTGNESVQ